MLIAPEVQRSIDNEVGTLHKFHLTELENCEEDAADKC